jgi:hypothetical protein
MMSISPYNPEYNAKPWLAKSSSQSLPTAGGQSVPIATQAFPENRWGDLPVTTLALGENGGGKGWSPIPKDRVFTTLAAMGENGNNLPPVTTLTALDENGQGFPPITTMADGNFENGGGYSPVQTMKYPENVGRIVTTLAIPENGGGALPIYRKPIVCNFPPIQTMAYPENGGRILTTLAENENGGGSSVDPYAMVQNPWMSNSPQSPISENPFWEV